MPFIAFNNTKPISIEKIDYYEISELDHLLVLGHDADLLGKLITRLGTLFGG